MPGVHAVDGLHFLADGGQSEEKKLGDVGEGVGAGAVNAILGEEIEEFAEDAVDVRGGFVFAGEGSEFGGDEGGVVLGLSLLNMAIAEGRMGVRNEVAAAAIGGITITATSAFHR